MVLAFAFLGLISIQMVATRSSTLFTHRLWLDEYHTLLIAEDPDLFHAMDALKHGADVNVPGLYLMTRMVTRCVGSTGPAVLRSIGFASVIVGLLGVYVSISRVYSPSVAFIGSMAAWSHPIIIEQAFQARFYGPWFAGIVWFAFALNLWDRSMKKLGPGLLVAALAIFVCTMHYFGVFSLALVAISHSLCAGISWKKSVARLIPALSGPLALALCLPLYFGQKASLSVPTWISPPTSAFSNNYLANVFRSYFLVIPIGGLFLSLAFRREGRPSEADSALERDRLPELAGLAGLALFPIFLVAFSYLVQPAMVDRYAIPLAAAMAVLISPLVSRTSPAFRWCILAGFLFFSSAKLMGDSRHYVNLDASRVVMGELMARRAKVPILFASRKVLYESWWDSPSLREQFFLWSIADDVPERPAPSLIVERDMARNHERWYGMTKSMNFKSLENYPLFFLVGMDTEKEVKQAERAHPELSFRLIDQDHQIFEVTKTPPSSRPLRSP